MQANVGDHIIIKSNKVGQPERDAQVVEVRGPDGGSPYLVRWADGHEALFYPGNDALVVHSR
jgi:hypothetical protein